MSALITGLVIAALSGFGTASLAPTVVATSPVPVSGVPFSGVPFTEISAGVTSSSDAALSRDALAGPPSEACRNGAVLCREAYEKLEECELSQAAATQAETEAEAEAELPADACAEARAEADARCRDTTSACDTDGSRLPPTR